MKPRYQYEIIIENKVMWRGLDPKQAYNEIKKKYPNKKIGIAWRAKDGDVIIYLGL